jgi:hypothetical protein
MGARATVKAVWPEGKPNPARGGDVSNPRHLHNGGLKPIKDQGTVEMNTVSKRRRESNDNDNDESGGYDDGDDDDDGQSGDDNRRRDRWWRNTLTWNGYCRNRLTWNGYWRNDLRYWRNGLWRNRYGRNWSERCERPG